MIYTLPESQDAKLSNSAYGIVFGSVFMEIWTNLSTLQHHCNISFAHCISLICSSLSFSSLLLLSSTLYLCYPLCQLSSLLISLSLCLFLSLSLCSLVLFAQTETLSAELKHYSSVFSVLDSPDWNIVCRVETSLTELKHYSFGSLVFSAELPWHTLCYNVSQKASQQVAVVPCWHYPNGLHIRGNSSE